MNILKYVPAAEARQEIIVLNSRFIASASPTTSTDEAKIYIQKIKTEFPDANHNVNAYLIGHGNNTISHCSDDGEPSGTAGRPVLSVLMGSGFGDLTVVVTRYFGGIKLGTGGLVRAYSDAAKNIIQRLEKAVKILTSTYQVEITYGLNVRMKLGIKSIDGKILSTNYGSEIIMTIQLPVEKSPQFTQMVNDISSGKSKIKLISENDQTIVKI
jgi:uncharacterized YigZ family protein